MTFYTSTSKQFEQVLGEAFLGGSKLIKCTCVFSPKLGAGYGEHTLQNKRQLPKLKGFTSFPLN